MLNFDLLEGLGLPINEIGIQKFRNQRNLIQLLHNLVLSCL